MPRWTAIPGIAAVGAGVAFGLLSRRPSAEKPADPAGAQLAMPDDARLA